MPGIDPGAGGSPSSEQLQRPGEATLAVLGSPISHSKSPAIHGAAYRVLDLPWEYGAVALEETELGPFLESRGPEWRGCSLTMPLKDEAARLATVLDPVAEESGVVNTLFRLVTSGGAPQWAGFNTDVGGLSRALERAGADPERTLVLGAGATAVSALLAARGLGAVRLAVAARRLEAAESLAARFGVEAGVLGALPGWQPTLVISTLPGPAGASVPLPAGICDAPLFDVAYDPWPSPLAARWRDAGGTTFSGVEMLVEQALLQVRIFVNGDPSVAVAREAEVLAAMRAASVER